MAGVKLLAVHVGGQQRFRVKGLGQRQTAGEGLGLAAAFFLAAVGAVENELDRVGPEAGSFEHGAEGNTGPFGVADGAGGPLHALDEGAKEGSTVAGAFHRGKHGALRERLEVLPRELEGTFDAAVDGETPEVGVDLGRFVVATDEEPAVGRDPTGNIREGRLAVFGRGAENFLADGHKVAWTNPWAEPGDIIVNGHRGIRPATGATPVRRTPLAPAPACCGVASLTRQGNCTGWSARPKPERA